VKKGRGKEEMQEERKNERKKKKAERKKCSFPESLKDRFTLISDASVPYQNLTPLRRICVNMVLFKIHLMMFLCRTLNGRY
jgi:uncharacterized protein YdeI (YjbR/CyaY-like superfamily)